MFVDGVVHLLVLHHKVQSKFYKKYLQGQKNILQLNKTISKAKNQKKTERQKDKQGDREKQ
jgi:hypothetical protein